MFIFEIITAIWFFVFGSVIGSFMNVVVYRTPRGKSIVGSSRCPQCDHAIRWHDNIPILGWFLLKGKCRDCSLPISFRYPTVEFVTACLFLVLAIAELYSGGANLPGYGGTAAPGFSGLIADMDWKADEHWMVVRVYVLHVLLVSTLFCWALICVDDQRVPTVQIGALWLIGFAASAIWPDIHPLSFTGQPTGSGDVALQWGGFQTAVFGFLAAGMVYLCWTALERYVVPQMTTEANTSDAANTAFCAGIGSIGIILGWQAVVSILFLTALSRGIFTLSGFRSARLRATPLLIDMLVATVIHVCFWSRLWQLPSWPGAGSGWAALLGVGIALLVLTFSAPLSLDSCDGERGA